MEESLADLTEKATRDKTPPESLMRNQQKPNIFQKGEKSVLRTQEFLQNHSISNKFQAFYPP